MNELTLSRLQISQSLVIMLRFKLYTERIQLTDILVYVM